MPVQSRGFLAKIGVDFEIVENKFSSDLSGKKFNKIGSEKCVPQHSFMQKIV